MKVTFDADDIKFLIRKLIVSYEEQIKLLVYKSLKTESELAICNSYEENCGSDSKLTKEKEYLTNVYNMTIKSISKLKTYTNKLRNFIEYEDNYTQYNLKSLFDIKINELDDGYME